MGIFAYGRPGNRGRQFTISALLHINLWFCSARWQRTWTTTCSIIADVLAEGEIERAAPEIGLLAQPLDPFKRLQFGDRSCSMALSVSSSICETSRYQAGSVSNFSRADRLRRLCKRSKCHPNNMPWWLRRTRRDSLRRSFDDFLDRIPSCQHGNRYACRGICPLASLIDPGYRGQH